MDRKYIDDHHVVARYLANQLPDAQREAFEAYYLEHPEVLQEMEAAARFKVGMMQLRESGELDRLMHPRPWFQERRYLAAAAAAAAVIVGLLFIQLRSPSMQPLLVASSSALVDRLGDPLPIAGTYAILRTRSVAYDAEISLPSSAQIIKLRVLPEMQARPAGYRITISSIDDGDRVREVATLGPLHAAGDGFVPVYLNSSRLRAGRYEIRIGPAEAGATTRSSRFLIRIRSHDETDRRPE